MDGIGVPEWSKWQHKHMKIYESLREYLKQKILKCQHSILKRDKHRLNDYCKDKWHQMRAIKIIHGQFYY